MLCYLEMTARPGSFRNLVFEYSRWRFDPAMFLRVLADFRQNSTDFFSNSKEYERTMIPKTLLANLNVKDHALPVE
jgi:hypothetical protein